MRETKIVMRGSDKGRVAVISAQLLDAINDILGSGAGFEVQR